MTETSELLRQYVNGGSDSAFRELVERHVDLVYSTALRKTGGNSHLAQDITQTVFTDLARKARLLPAGVVLSGWLYRHTCFRRADKSVRHTAESFNPRGSTQYAGPSGRPGLPCAALRCSGAIRGFLL
ncbi:MAG: hypothetical protein HY735_37780 [Verrucomicrobia bacterium]|nr:hypothetical protein [Verrucomicrobiota bacterium]